MSVSQRRRREVLDALRRGTVPAHGLDLLAVGLERLEPALMDDLDQVVAGRASFKAVRGEYGAGKTFLVRWLADRARQRGLATAEVQISETETPLHRLETVYRRITETLTTAEFPASALRPVVDAWVFALEEDVLAGGVEPSDEVAWSAAVDALLERRLVEVSRRAPGLAPALRAYRHARAQGDGATADALLAWVGGQPHVAAGAKRLAGVRGDLDHFGALGFLEGLLAILRDAGHPGLLVVLDEVETLQRVRGDVRERALNSLRQLLDEIDAGRFPGLALIVTGTPAFFDGPQGVQRLPPLAQRLATDFGGDPRFDNPRAVQVRLPGFSPGALRELGSKVRDLVADGSPVAERVRGVVDDAYVASLADAVGGSLSGKVGVAPRIYLKKLVDVCDRVEEHPDYDPQRDYRLTVAPTELTAAERELLVVPAARADDVQLDLT